MFLKTTDDSTVSPSLTNPKLTSGLSITSSGPCKSHPGLSIFECDTFIGDLELTDCNRCPSCHWCPCRPKQYKRKTQISQVNRTLHWPTLRANLSCRGGSILHTRLYLDLSLNVQSQGFLLVMDVTQQTVCDLSRRRATQSQLQVQILLWTCIKSMESLLVNILNRSPAPKNFRNTKDAQKYLILQRLVPRARRNRH